MKLIILQLHMDDEGHAIDTDKYNIYFNQNQIEAKLLPAIILPFQSSIQPLIDLWKAVEICSRHNSGVALFTFGAVAMNMHFQILVELKGGALL